MTGKVLPYLWYPLFTGAAVAAFFWMLSLGTSTALAAYVPVIAVGVIIVLLEWRFPEHLEWRPRVSDVHADAAFMAFVQVAVPQALAALAILAISAWMHAHAPTSVWPHEWPLLAQALFMVLAIDLVRYWLHRACHRFPVLWRLHEVHHSPDILYVLNVGRFHPLEKALHFCLDTAPFLVLGVAPEVIACYFLLYSVNGLFQHSNVRLRYGWLNYVVGSAETHRWHHARDPKTAACNFSNTTIFWDLVFGTWYLPADRGIKDIGIMDRTYPNDFWMQMSTPFRRTALRRRSLRVVAANALVRLHLLFSRLVHGRRISALLDDPMRAQRAVLEGIVRENNETIFGRAHGFAGVHSIEDYRLRVPVYEYEALRPYVEAEMERGEQALTMEPPQQYARTSGTTGKAKDLPLTRSHLAALKRIQQAAVAFQYRTCPEAFAGGIVVIVSPPVEGAAPNGKPYGSASGMVAGSTPALVRDKFVVPAAVLAIDDSQLKYLTVLRLALARPDVTYLGSANPTTMLMLAKLFREHERALIGDLRSGTFFRAGDVPADVMTAIGRSLGAMPARAEDLETLRARSGELRLRDLWPELRLVVTWTCASAGVAVDALRKELHPATHILELGYVASEFRGTITLGRRAGSGWPTLDTHFFEFVEREKWDSGEPEFLTLDQLRKGVDYYIIVTTPSGLYRYFVNDLVRVTGFLRRTPLLKFSQKGKGVTNITGEKLYEAQMLAAVHSVMSKAGSDTRFVMMLADEPAQRYRLYVEAGPGPKPHANELARGVDQKLRELNLEYGAKRDSERLAPLAATWLEAGTGDAYKQYCVARGQREGQFKTVSIAYRKAFHFDLESRAEAESR